MLIRTISDALPSGSDTTRGLDNAGPSHWTPPSIQAIFLD